MSSDFIRDTMLFQTFSLNDEQWYIEISFSMRERGAAFCSIRRSVGSFEDHPFYRENTNAGGTEWDKKMDRRGIWNSPLPSNVIAKALQMCQSYLKMTALL